jgi:hypothetical protein
VDSAVMSTPNRIINTKFFLTMNFIIKGPAKPVAKLESVSDKDNEAMPVFKSKLIGKKKIPDTF